MRLRELIFILSVAVLASLFWGVTAFAACEFMPGTMDLDFGAFDAQDPVDKVITGYVTLMCENDPEYSMGLNDGLYGLFPMERRMAGPTGDYLRYWIYQDPTHTIPWGNLGSGHELTAPVPMPNQSFTVNIYGVVTGSQNVQPGSYSDKVDAYVDPAGFPSSVRFNIWASILEPCSVTVTDLIFDPLVGLPGGYPSSTGTGEIKVECPIGTTYSVGLDDGSNPGGGTGRRMFGGTGGEYLPYGLYQDPGHSIPWGDIDSGNEREKTSTGTIDSHNVYGLIPTLASTIGPGLYTDTVRVTVVW